MLTIQVEFPSGRYLAAQSGDPSLPEWPPHPARLFSAFVAAAYRGNGGISPSGRSALEWLEALPPPALWAPPADLSPAPVSFVPPGDMVEAKGGKDTKRYEHPIFRWRQDRRFPEARILGEPRVEFHWKTSPSPDMLASLQHIARDITHVGTSHSMAIVTVSESAPTLMPNYMPGESGAISLRTTLAGRLAELDRVFNLAESVRRPLPQFEHYSSYAHENLPDDLPDSSPRDLMALRIDGPQYALEDTYVLMRAIRAALMSVLGDDAPASLHGHGESEHLAWLPLADVGHVHASGMLLGVGLAVPKALAESERLALLRGLGRLGRVLLPDGRTIGLSVPPPGSALPKALLVATWTRPSHDWATVTPVVLDRAPKRSDPEKLTRALAESLQMAGYPEPEEITLSSVGSFYGSPRALAFRATQPRFHARVRFPEMVAGPVIVGRQRFFGVGFFRPVPNAAVSR